MKKLLSGLLLGVFVLLPFAVNAETVTNGYVSIEQGNEVVNANGTKSRSDKVTVTSPDSSVPTSVVVELVDIGTGITSITCKGNDYFTATSKQTTSTQLTCTFTAKSGVASAKTYSLGTIELVAAASGDCSYSINKTTYNPGTGLNIPYVAIGGGLLFVGAVYVLTRKHNKLYKI